jgi:hypothetical protein
MPSNEYLSLEFRFNKIQEVMVLTTYLMHDCDAESVMYDLLTKTMRLYATESLELKKQMEIERNK